MTSSTADWEQRLEGLWAAFDRCDEDEFVRRIEQLVAELPPGSPIGLFERGGAFDSTGHPDQAVSLYAMALDAGLAGVRRRRAVIQMASSLRNLGKPQEALDLLTAEARAASDDLDGAVAATQALALASLGRDREALAVALTALAKYLPRYNRSVARYAQDLLNEAP